MWIRILKNYANLNKNLIKHKIKYALIVATGMSHTRIEVMAISKKVQEKVCV